MPKRQLSTCLDN